MVKALQRILICVTCFPKGGKLWSTGIAWCLRVILCYGFLFAFFPQVFQIFHNWIIQLDNLQQVNGRKVFKQDADPSSCAGDKLPGHSPLRHLWMLLYTPSSSLTSCFRYEITCIRRTTWVLNFINKLKLFARLG